MNALALACAGRVLDVALPPQSPAYIPNLTCTSTCYCADYNSTLALACAGRGVVKSRCLPQEARFLPVSSN